MKISLNWLKDYVSWSGSAEELAHRLTMAGLEVEKIHSVDGDTVFELEITPNRPDCLNTIGIAREISAIFNKPLKTPLLPKIKSVSQKCDITIEDKKDCSRYVGTVIENVKIRAASVDITKKLSAIGNRSINNVVDITNFVLMEMGQPLHAFDYDKLLGRKIIVRRAKAGETIVTIDGVERKLDPSILVVADEKRPVAIAGIMGGKDTEVTNETRHILLESAYFDQGLIRRAGRKLGLSSDSSYRFERGVDYTTVETASNRATALIIKEAGGEISKRSDVQGPVKAKTKPAIKISLDEINSYLGADLGFKQCQDILKRLGFSVKTQKTILNVIGPQVRNDINQNVDVIEEIARIVGYDNLPLSLPEIKAHAMRTSSKVHTKRALRNHMIALGFDEIVTYSMYDQKSLQKTKLDQNGAPIKIQNPLSMEQEMMRPDVLPSLLNVVLNNLNKGQKDLKLFEVAKQYLPDAEKEVLAIVACGRHAYDWRQKVSREIDFYDIKGAFESVLNRFNIKNFTTKDTDSSLLEEGQRGQINTPKTQNFVVFGQVAQDILTNWDIKAKNVLVGFLDLDQLYNMAQGQERFTAIPEYPGITRDISLSAKRNISFDQIKDVAREQGGDILKSIEFKEEYLGEKIAAGERGLVFSLYFQSSSRTLREDEVNAAFDKIIQALIGRLGVVKR